VGKALGIDSTLGEARTSLAQILHREWDWEGAEREYKRAIQLNPGYPTAHHWYALSLAYAGRSDEAIAEIRRALQLDPLSLIINRNLGLVLYYARCYDQAAEQLVKTLEMEPAFSLVHASLGRICVQRGLYQKALSEFQKEKDNLGSSNPELESWQGIACAKMGRIEEADKILTHLLQRAEHAYVPPILVASLCFALGKSVQGFEWLEKGYRQHDSTMVEIKADPGFDGVRSDPRFTQLLKKVGLEK
jgi:serine/threonine-protein kinase